MEFTTWPGDFFSKPVCKFGSISIIVHKAHQMLKQGHRKLCRTIQQNVTQHCRAVRNRSILYIDSLNSAIPHTPARARTALYCSYPSVCNRVFNSVLHSGAWRCLASAPAPAPVPSLGMAGGAATALPASTRAGGPCINNIFLIFISDGQLHRLLFIFWGHVKQIQFPS